MNDDAQGEQTEGNQEFRQHEESRVIGGERMASKVFLPGCVLLPVMRLAL
jgi:hypothetical protein